MNGRFPHLMAFSGGLATVFLCTAVVQSDFSVLKYEKNPFRTAFWTSPLKETIRHIVLKRPEFIEFELFGRENKLFSVHSVIP